MGQSKSKPLQFYWEFINHSHEDIINSKCYYGTEKNHTARVQNLEGLRISSNGSTIREEASASLFFGCPFYMTLFFSNGTTDEFRIILPSKESIEFSYLRGSHHVTCYRSLLSSSSSKVTVSIENNQQQLDDERATEKNKEGETAMEQKQYEAAVKIFGDALSLANQDAVVTITKKNKILACDEFGKECLNEAWHLEKNNNKEQSQEAEDMFLKAKSLFQEAQNLGSSSNHENLDIIDLKIEGNQLLREANELEREAFKLFNSVKSDDNTSAHNMHQEALVKYEEAIKKFEQGLKLDSKFDDNLKIANERVQDVKTVAGNIDRVEL